MSRSLSWWWRVLFVTAMIGMFGPQADATGPSSASTTHADGTTETIELRPDGTRVRTITDADGQVVSSAPIPPEPPTKVPPREHGTSASTTDANGNTVTIKKNSDGSTTRTVTRPDGTVVSSEPLAPEPPTKVPPREHGTSASTKDADGNTVTIKTNPDGSKTRTVTRPDGSVVSSEPLTPEPPTKAPPREHGTSVSTTDANGNTVTIKTNPDGTKTRTVTAPDGHVISSEPMTPEPPTKIKPRPKGSSASTTDANGNTITVETRSDGTRVRITTDAFGKILKKEPLTLQPVGAQLLYDTVKKDNCTANTAMVLRMDHGKTVLDVSVLGIGEGGNARSWVPEKVFLILGKDKLKPVATTPYFVEKESAARGLAPVLFAAIAAEYAEDADKAEASKGTPCPLTGKVEGGEKHERGKLGRAIDKAGMVAGLSLLASQAKGQIEGRRVTFDVTGREHELVNGAVLARLRNTEPQRLNLSNEPDQVDAKIPVKFTVAAAH